MRLRVISFIMVLAVIFGSGCYVILPTDSLSSLVLHPDTTCRQLATGLGLGQFPSASTPAEIGLQYQSFSVTSANGERLAGWFVPAQLEEQLDDTAAGTTLFMHGTDGSMACTLPWILVATSNHMHAVVFDYQGYGDSGGMPDIATQLDDAEAVLNWILGDDASARQKVHLFGISLGTGPALGLAALRTQPQIQSVVLDGAYDPEAMAVATEQQLGLFFPLIGESARLGFAWLFETRAQLDKMTIPVMFMHAENDAITPLSGAQTMFDRMGSARKTLWLFENMTHIQPLFGAEEGYVSLAVTFWRDPAGQPSSNATETDATIRVPSFSL